MCLTSCNTFQKHLLSQKENLIFWLQKWIFEISEVGFQPFFSFVLSTKVAFATCHNFKNVKITLLNVFDKLQYIPETFIESKRKFDFSTSKMDFRNFWGRFSAIFSFVLSAKVDFAVCHNFKNVKITLLNVFDKLQYIPETFIESKRKFDFLTSKMDFWNFWSCFWLILTSKHEKMTL